jgi:hypothetical protein
VKPFGVEQRVNVLLSGRGPPGKLVFQAARVHVSWSRHFDGQRSSNVFRASAFRHTITGSTFTQSIRSVTAGRTASLTAYQQSGRAHGHWAMPRGQCGMSPYGCD